MTVRLIFASITLALTTLSYGQSSDSLVVVAEGRVINGETNEPVTARIQYQSLPYGNKVGVITNSSFTFPMFDGEKYAITVDAKGFEPAKYMLDPAEANTDRKVIKDIVLSTSGRPKTPTHPVGQVIRLNNLIFSVGNSKIDPESYGELDALVTMMKENPTMVIQLEGHTDYVGLAADNLRLSQKRVESVRTYLASKGITRTRLKTKAFGGSQPLSRENTPEAHRLNRRVEVRILQN